MKKLFLFLSFFLVLGTSQALASAVPTMDKETLKAELNSQSLVVLDVRSGRDWSSSEFKIQGAVRAPGSKLAEWSKRYTKDQKLVLYCA